MYEIDMTSVDSDVTDIIIERVNAHLTDEQENVVNTMKASQLITINGDGPKRDRLIGELRFIVSDTADEELAAKVTKDLITTEEYNNQRHSIEFNRLS